MREALVELFHGKCAYCESRIGYEPETGLVLGESGRAHTTIEIIGLNRPALMDARRSAARAFQTQISEIERMFDTADSADALESGVEALARLTPGPDQEYAGLRRQLARRAIDRFGRRRSRLCASLESPSMRRPKVTKARTVRAKRSHREYERQASHYSLATKEGRQKYREHVRAIEHVAITNVRAIKRLDLDFTVGPSGGLRWLTLLGENGAGKSTVLKAIALTLIGADYFLDLARRTELRPSDYIRRRCRQASVEVKITGFPKPHRLVFRRQEVEFHDPNAGGCRVVFGEDGPVLEGSGWPPQIVVLGYGATRLLPQRSRTRPMGGDYSRVENLFDPFQLELTPFGGHLISLEKGVHDAEKQTALCTGVPGADGGVGPSRSVT